VATQAPSRSTSRLSEVARHLVYPDGIVSTNWPRIKRRLSEMAVEYDGWQEGVTTIILGLDENGRYSATVGGVTLSVPRQVGKTFTVGSLLVAMCLEFPGLRVVWTSHHLRTTTNTFRSMQGMVRRKRIAPQLAHNGIRTANGEQEIRFANGSIIMFGARERGFGVGIDAIDILVCDEAQRLSSRALADMMPTTNQARHPHGALVFFIGTPPRPTDEGDEFAARRTKALAGELPTGIYVELSADADADIDDPEQWAKANASYPHRTPHESMLRLRENLTNDDDWRREALGIWDVAASKGVIPAPSWVTQGHEHSLAVDRFALGVECGPDLAWASVAFAGQRADGEWHFELDEDQHTKGRGTAWLVSHLEYLTAHNSQIRAVVGDVAGPIAALLEKRGGRYFFKGSNLELTPVKVTELGAGCSRVLDGIVTGWLHHIDQPQFTAAALSAGKRALGDTGMWVWSRKAAESDITPIQAGTLALIGAQAERGVKKPTKQAGGRRVVTV
jgi:hypothetical protein